ncbi:hypothetical protein [Clostridium estertheticum]|uniref:Uncharacterized protein n=1 Tax=Clostridium estertheticum TaxID=238834 RepID=A0AA47EIK9_9CLOT|nr:hypothetical protein [Clostridium estertheticum]MBU3153480.1 hypothetical protein [Clostridium estertheticum]WAG60882.1 hypothetical protein LL038_01120 [Clostridium estertheticum]
MLVEKYMEEFKKVYNNDINFGQIFRDIIEVEKETKKELLKWGDEEVSIYLKKADAISPKTLGKRMSILRKIADFICTKEKITKRKYLIEEGMYMQFVEKGRLDSVTLTYDQYMDIKNQLDMTEDGEKVNLREKVIFELAWQGLTNEEIKFIKSENIKFETVEDDWEIILLEFEDKTIRIEDQEVIQDIKLCIKETYNVRTAKDGRIKKTFYKDSEYLIKPINVGRFSTKTYMNNPHLALQRVLQNGDFVCPGIDVENLTLSDIRRSKLIYLLAPENEEFFNIETVARLYNLRSPAGLSWFKKVAIEKYGAAK